MAASSRDEHKIGNPTAMTPKSGSMPTLEFPFPMRKDFQR